MTKFKLLQFLEKNKELKEDINKTQLKDLPKKIKDNISSPVINLYESPWLNSKTYDFSTTELNDTIYQTNQTGKIPQYININKYIDLNIPEYFIPFVRTSLLIDTLPQQELQGASIYEGVKIVDWCRIYGDTTLLYDGPWSTGNTTPDYSTPYAPLASRDEDGTFNYNFKNITDIKPYFKYSKKRYQYYTINRSTNLPISSIPFGLGYISTYPYDMNWHPETGKLLHYKLFRGPIANFNGFSSSGMYYPEYNATTGGHPTMMEILDINGDSFTLKGTETEWWNGGYIPGFEFVTDNILTATHNIIRTYDRDSLYFSSGNVPSYLPGDNTTQAELEENWELFYYPNSVYDIEVDSTPIGSIIFLDEELKWHLSVSRFYNGIAIGNMPSLSSTDYAMQSWNLPYSYFDISYNPIGSDFPFCKIQNVISGHNNLVISKHKNTENYRINMQNKSVINVLTTTPYSFYSFEGTQRYNRIDDYNYNGWLIDTYNRNLNNTSTNQYTVYKPASTDVKYKVRIDIVNPFYYKTELKTKKNDY
jgi:hypothetical protein